jgi:iron complex transport system ATP-binding protein
VKTLNEEHGLTIVMVLHDMNQAIKYSDYVILMKDGQVLTEGVPEQVMTKEIIKEVYGVDVLVETHERTGMYMVPISI